MRSALIFAFCLSLFAQGNGHRPAPDGALLALSEGKGSVRLLVWPSMKSPLPEGGWQIQDENGRVLVPTLKAGDADAIKGADASEALLAVKELGQLRAEKDPGQRRLIALTLLVKSGSQPELGRALGLGCTLQGQTQGRHAYVAVALDGTGKPTGMRLKSPTVDPGEAAPLPKAPEGLRAEAAADSVLLYWKPVNGGDVPILDYRVQRGSQVLTPDANILGVWEESKPAYLDREAPGDQASEYHVWAVDIFGRRGTDSVVGVFFPDPATLRPPTQLTARSEAGANVLNFRPSPTARTSGILVERSLDPAGLFEVVTPHPLQPSTSNFSDGNVGGGATYYYRLRAVDADGNLGGPGKVAYVIARSAGKPLPPAELKVNETPLGNTLVWKPAELPMAGYLVERRLGDGVWTRQGSKLALGGHYEDLLTSDISGPIQYRVSAITFDNFQSDPSAPVLMVRANLTAPEPPILQTIDGANGVVHLRFRAAAPEARTGQILVLRSVQRREASGAESYGTELIVEDPLPGSVHEFVDEWVDPGEIYRYRLVAVSPEGIRSEASAGVLIRVSPPPVPEPPKPELAFATTPFRHVQAKLPAIPEGFRAYLHRKGPGESQWTVVQGPFEALEIVDARPVAGRVQYRIHLEDSKGLTGRSGAPVEIEIRP